MMNKTLAGSLVALGLAFAAPALAVTNQPLPASVANAIQAATSAEDIAALVAARPGLAATIMFEAAQLGVASPSAVVAILAGGLPRGQLSALVSAAAEAAPLEADLVAAEAAGAGGDTGVIATAAVNGIESVQPALSQEQVDAEAAEILAALGGGSAIAEAIAGATDNPSDSADSLLAADDGGDDGIITATLPENNGGAPLSFASLPSETQNNPSGN